MRGAWNGSFDEIKVKAVSGDDLGSKETSQTQISGR